MPAAKARKVSVLIMVFVKATSARLCGDKLTILSRMFWLRSGIVGIRPSNAPGLRVSGQDVSASWADARCLCGGAGCVPGPPVGAEGQSGLLCAVDYASLRVRRMSRSRTGRELVMDWLQREIRLATTADLQRAAAFLEWARGVRKGCSKQRGGARVAQANAWRKRVDEDVRW